jgi:hypothetical protein
MSISAAFLARNDAYPLTQAEAQRQATGPTLLCRYAISAASARRLPAGARFARTLGVMENFAKFVVATFLCASALVGAAGAAEPEADHWLSFRRFIGEWRGTTSGQPGDGTVTRTYTYVMNGRFIHETNTSRYPPRENGRTGEVHQHWGIFSYDRARRLVVLRQFHIEGFVNTYRQTSTTDEQASLVFESETFENLSNSWKARESYEFLSDAEFIETFELAPPGKSYQVYSRNHFKRVPD